MRIIEIFRLVNSEHFLSGSSDSDVVVDIRLEKLERAKVGIRLEDDSSTDLGGEEGTPGREAERLALSPLSRRVLTSE